MYWQGVYVLSFLQNSMHESVLEVRINHAVLVETPSCLKGDLSVQTVLKRKMTKMTNIQIKWGQGKNGGISWKRSAKEPWQITEVERGNWETRLDTAQSGPGIATSFQLRKDTIPWSICAYPGAEHVGHITGNSPGVWGLLPLWVNGLNQCWNTHFFHRENGGTTMEDCWWPTPPEEEGAQWPLCVCARARVWLEVWEISYRTVLRNL